MADKRIYTVDWKKLAVLLLLVDLRTPKQKAWLYALTSPVVDLYNRFMAYRAFTNYQLTITPQRCYVQKAINDRFDNVNRRITIISPDKKQPLILYRKDENKPQKLYTKGEATQLVLYRKSETAQFTVNFIVVVPFNNTFNYQEMEAFIKTYALPSRTFTIKGVKNVQTH